MHWIIYSLEGLRQRRLELLALSPLSPGPKTP